MRDRKDDAVSGNWNTTDYYASLIIKIASPRPSSGFWEFIRTFDFTFRFGWPGGLVKPTWVQSISVYTRRYVPRVRT